MKIRPGFILTFLFGALFFHSGAQTLVSTSAADLRIFVDGPHGEEIMLQTRSMGVTYEPGAVMNGELYLSSLETSSDIARALLDSLEIDMIGFTSKLPAEELLYGEEMNQKIPAETLIRAGKKEATVMFVYEANRKSTNDTRIYQVSARGSIDLEKEFNITRDIGMEKTLRFQFYHTVEVHQY